ncbi:MAG: exonuclease SbcCD subunit D [Deltaproteobacteria bacterium]|nr:exonuclease SbcCD subunit D [Deltaproteobacteria bacterium]
MRFLHTADWHLGRIFHGVHLTEDQAQVLEQFIGLARDCRPDAVLVAGDVYDRAVPPPEAVDLLSQVLSELVLGVGVPVVMISGNHDSAPRLRFASRLLARGGLHLLTQLAPEPRAVELADEHGPVCVYALPFTAPAEVRQVLGRDDVATHDAAAAALLAGVREAPRPAGARTVVVAHAFVAGGLAGDSERPLAVGGAEQVAVERFAGFDFVALGHLHRPQSLAEGRVSYAGSPLKFSFAEAGQEKSVSLVELDARGKCRVERIALPPRREVRRLEGRLAELLAGPPPGVDRGDYLAVALTDREAILDAMGQLREVYPHLLHLERPGLKLAEDQAREKVEPRGRGEGELFTSFFRQVTGAEPSEAEMAAFTRVAGRVRDVEREALS